MSIYRDFEPDYGATVVERLYHAGAMLIRKLSLTESAYTNNHPVFPTPIHPWGADHWAGSAPSDVAGNPTIVLPAGFSRNIVPISLELVRKHLGEAGLCAAARVFQQVTAWHPRHPIS